MASFRHKKNTKKDISEKIIYPDNLNWFFYLSLSFTFLISFAIYILTLAPDITLEDSGELITAAKHLGVPHEPGYPLFTMLGKLFTFLPIGNIAYRLNLMSAFFSALAGALVYIATVLFIENTWVVKLDSKSTNGNKFRFFRYLAGITSALLFSFSFENWEQSVITEVYGLHVFFVAGFIVLFCLLARQKDDSGKRKYFYLISLLTGLSLTNHSTSVLFVPIVLIILLIMDFRFLISLKTLRFALLFGIAGLLPLLYLPLSSITDPVIDWGNPENLTNFLRTISRHQYTSLDQSSDKFFSGLGFFFGKTLIDQWFPAVLFLLIPGLIALYKFNKKGLIFSILFIVFYIPVTTYLTDFEIRGDTFVNELNRLLVTVFYLPSYLFLSIIMGIGTFYLLQIVKKEAYKYSILAVVLLFSFISLKKNYKRVDMSDFHYPQRYLDNLFKVVSQDALIFTQIDYYYFPTMYAQNIEGRRTDVTILDQPLLKRSWYIDMLINHYNELTSRSKPAVNAFLKAVAPFEDGKPYNGANIEARYIGMINSFIDEAFQAGKDVYFTYIPQKEILRSYYLDSVLGAYKLSRSGEITSVNYNELNFNMFGGISKSDDLLVRNFSNYYGELHLMRATWYEGMGDIENAFKFYELSNKFYLEKAQARSFINSKLKELRPLIN
ncbi:MAG: DUF2723 domain-containing protein [Bacteroidales bacterium]|nr:DUF2723 domain-containing protein [Bacteroidales bacterium]MCF8404638.1 DUF2723 domain-containing protein [Bacteroidales bacterium]